MAAAASDVRVLLIQISLMLLSLTGTEIGFVMSIVSHTSTTFLTPDRLPAFRIWCHSFLFLLNFKLCGHFHPSLVSLLFIRDSLDEEPKAQELDLIQLLVYA